MQYIEIFSADRTNMIKFPYEIRKKIRKLKMNAYLNVKDSMNNFLAEYKHYNIDDTKYKISY
jgi:hypothetical protein